MRSAARCYPELREHCQATPIVDSHDHATQLGPAYADPIQAVLGEYLFTDLASATSDVEMTPLLDGNVPWRERWPLLERAWARTKHTGYAEVTRRVLRRFYDEEDVTFSALECMEDRLLDLTDAALYTDILDDAKIVVRLEDVWPAVEQILDRSYTLTPRGRLVIPLPSYHRVRGYLEVQSVVAPLKRTVSTLDDYVAACWEIFQAFKAFGAVAFKDQSAYFRALDYTNPTRAEAEAVFNRFMADPMLNVAYPTETRPLDDYLFHQYLRMAQEMGLPVQLHTGHLAGLYGDITQANAVQLAHLFLLHREVRFDLFHANWPYSGEALYLAKNFPNVALNFCWANMIDPVYSRNLFGEALATVPHSKIHAHGSDFGGFGYAPGGYVDHAWAHTDLARDNIAMALAEMVEMEYLSGADAKVVMEAWLFDNANEFYALGLTR